MDNKLSWRSRRNPNCHKWVQRSGWIRHYSCIQNSHPHSDPHRNFLQCRVKIRQRYKSYQRLRGTWSCLGLEACSRWNRHRNRLCRQSWHCCSPRRSNRHLRYSGHCSKMASEREQRARLSSSSNLENRITHHISSFRFSSSFLCYEFKISIVYFISLYDLEIFLRISSRLVIVVVICLVLVFKLNVYWFFLQTTGNYL